MLVMTSITTATTWPSFASRFALSMAAAIARSREEYSSETLPYWTRQPSWFRSTRIRIGAIVVREAGKKERDHNQIAARQASRWGDGKIGVSLKSYKQER